MKKLILCIVIIPFLLVYCERNKDILDPAGNGNHTIKYGTSFGECRGYCKKDLVIYGRNVTFTATSSIQQQNAEKSISGQLTENEYQHLLSLIDFDEILKYDDVIGCPDCTDGGAEWIQVKQDGQTKKITFEYGDTLKTINKLIEQLRDIFQSYDKKMFPDLNILQTEKNIVI